MEQQSTYLFDEKEITIEDPTLGISIKESSEGCVPTSLVRSDGTVFFISIYKNGCLHGPSRAYFHDGVLASERWFYNGQAHGRSVEYAPSGQMLSRKGYYQGQLEGECFRWHPNGKLQLSCSFRKGMPEGCFELFGSDGLSLRSVAFTRGRRDGLDTGWTEEGYLLFCELWASGEKQKTILKDSLAKGLGL